MKQHKPLIVLGAVVLVVTYIVAMLFAPGPESGLVGEWYLNDKLFFTFYSDGTCKVRGEYGTCQWDVVDEQLKIINVYAQTYASDYTLNGNKLVINGNTFTRK